MVQPLTESPARPSPASSRQDRSERSIFGDETKVSHQRSVISAASLAALPSSSPSYTRRTPVVDISEHARISRSTSLTDVASAIAEHHEAEFTLPVARSHQPTALAKPSAGMASLTSSIPPPTSASAKQSPPSAADMAQSAVVVPSSAVASSVSPAQISAVVISPPTTPSTQDQPRGSVAQSSHGGKLLWENSIRKMRQKFPDSISNGQNMFALANWIIEVYDLHRAVAGTPNFQWTAFLPLVWELIPMTVRFQIEASRQRDGIHSLGELFKRLAVAAGVVNESGSFRQDAINKFLIGPKPSTVELTQHLVRFRALHLMVPLISTEELYGFLHATLAPAPQLASLFNPSILPPPGTDAIVFVYQQLHQRWADICGASARQFGSSNVAALHSSSEIDAISESRHRDFNDRRSGPPPQSQRQWRNDRSRGPYGGPHRDVDHDRRPSSGPPHHGSRPTQRSSGPSHPPPSAQPKFPALPAPTESRPAGASQPHANGQAN